MATSARRVLSSSSPAYDGDCCIGATVYSDCICCCWAVSALSSPRDEGTSAFCVLVLDVVVLLPVRPWLTIMAENSEASAPGGGETFDWAAPELDPAVAKDDTADDDVSDKPERVATLFRVCPFILGNEFCERLAFFG